jgi:EmrB/QacA subfamily drug resistance transporter
VNPLSKEPAVGLPKRWRILGVLCLGLIVVIIDNTVLNVAVPTLMRELPATTAQTQWIVDAYPLVFAGLLITTGGLSDRYGRRRALLLGFVVFATASAAAAFASSGVELILLRGVMGVGGALIMPSTLSIVTQVFGEDERTKAMSIWGAAGMLAIAGGPALGGILVERFWWGSVFLINVPIAIAAAAATLLLVPESRDPVAGAPDLVGAALSIAAMAALVWGVISVPGHGWDGAQALGGFAVASAAGAAFVLWERRHPHPMLDLRLFRRVRFVSAITLVTIFAFGMAGGLFTLTQYLQLVRGYPPLQAGLALTPTALAGVAGSLLGGPLAARLGPSRAIASGMAVVAVAFCVLASLGVGSGYGPVLAGTALLGFGLGSASPAAYEQMLGAMPKERAGSASAVSDSAQEIGTAMGVAVVGSLVVAVYAAGLPVGAPATARESLAGGIGVPGLAAVARHAFATAMTAGCLASAACVAVAGGLALVLLRDPPSAAQPTGAHMNTTEKSLQ